ncbi:RNase HII [Pedobacter psychrotolerans]|uniref:Ribonuclease HII n=1 Tax=Pedobacter psychrotolerans TaxID=1843235 RepID=A0A4R2H9R3_9SPHI|nr:ribonuclease HII [Pedobacter psychrotolerans]TCO23748.1 RNase HII [Pedobacter psychrotolerans]GGE62313.1 ribonuclease HII [Pedobacter psychrotolerans]
MLLSCYQEEFLEAGCDEAGRGCLAGPVFAAAVILPKGFCLEGLNDSKQLSHNQRDLLRPIIEKEALAWAVASCDHEEIDQINILNASFLAMHRAIEKLHTQPQYLVIDGNRFKAYPQIPHCCIIKGDGKYLNIAAASILAKTHRDEFMANLHTDYPHYNWQKNKGYPTIAHRKAVMEIGLSPFHRKTFNVRDPQLDLFTKNV